jgi:hypothetical protein
MVDITPEQDQRNAYALPAAVHFPSDESAESIKRSEEVGTRITFGTR